MSSRARIGSGLVSFGSIRGKAGLQIVPLEKDSRVEKDSFEGFWADMNILHGFIRYGLSIACWSHERERMDLERRPA